MTGAFQMFILQLCIYLSRQNKGIPPPGFCEDKPLYNSHEECDKYIVCQGFSVAVILQCPSPLVWDDERKICNWIQYSSCKTKPTSLPSDTVTDQTKDLAKIPCDHTKCKLPNCRCQGNDIPGGLLRSHHIPQMVLISFEDGVNTANFQLYVQLLDGMKNPDGCPVKATFFISGEGNDFDLTKQLNQKGYEIGVKTTSHHALRTFWQNISYSDLVTDVVGLKIKLASTGVRHVTGYRSPFLQTAGDVTYTVLKDFGFRYDSSLPTRLLDKPWWPYTLDYGIKLEDCFFPPCPKYSHPGFWEVPLSSFQDNQQSCITYQSCGNHLDTIDVVFDFLVTNFKRHYYNNKAPFTLFGHASWMLSSRYTYRILAFIKFLNYVNSLPDVYIVSLTQALDWTQTPTDQTRLLRHQFDSWTC